MQCEPSGGHRAEGTETLCGLCGHKKSRADPENPLPMSYVASGRHVGPGLWSCWPQPRHGVPKQGVGARVTG